MTITSELPVTDQLVSNTINAECFLAQVTERENVQCRHARTHTVYLTDTDIHTHSDTDSVHLTHPHTHSISSLDVAKTENSSYCL